MRRSEREIGDRAEIDAVIRECRVCRLGLSDETGPYIVPMCFGYDGQSLFFHAAAEGRKIDMLRRGGRVCFEFDILDAMMPGEVACRWGMQYRSVIGFGTAQILSDSQAKREALGWVMRQYDNREYTFSDDAILGIVAIRLRIEEISGKRR